MTISMTIHVAANGIILFFYIAELYSTVCGTYIVVVTVLLLSHVQLFQLLVDSTRLLCPWNSSGKNTEVDFHAFLQGIFPTQGWNPSLLHCRWILCCLSHKGSHIYVYVCTHTHTHTYIHCTCFYIHIQCMCVYIYVCVYVYIFTQWNITQQ